MEPYSSGCPEGTWKSFGIFYESGFAGPGVRRAEGKKLAWGQTKEETSSLEDDSVDRSNERRAFHIVLEVVLTS